MRLYFRPGPQQHVPEGIHATTRSNHDDVLGQVHPEHPWPSSVIKGSDKRRDLSLLKPVTWAFDQQGVLLS